jgi:hypothetical protein
LETTVIGPAMVIFWWSVNCDSFWDALTFSVNGVAQSSITGTVDWEAETNVVGSGTEVLQWTLGPDYGAFAGGTAWVDQVQVIPIAGAAPAITAQPGNVSVGAGNNFSLSVAATGTAPLCYQWQFNGTNLPGGTNATLILANLQPANAGVYDVTVTNDYGLADSSNATLTVLDAAPTITTQPLTQTNVMNATAAFSVGVQGSLPFTYQWYFNGAPIAGAISNRLLVPNLQLSNAGRYSVVVSNALGEATSTAANLSVVTGLVLDYMPYGFMPLPTPANPGDVTAIAAGADHTVALRADGTVIAWGYDNIYGQTNVPAGLSNVTAIASGDNHCLALRADGTLVAWGDDGYGQAEIPAGLSNVVAIAAGPTYNLALRGDGTVVAWGNDDYGQIDVPASLTNAQTIFAGYNNGFALRADGSLAQWGNVLSWLHNGTNTQLNLAGSNLVSVAAGAFTGWSLDNHGTASAHGFFDGSAPYTNVYGGGSFWSTGIRGPNVYSNILAMAAAGSGDPNSDYVLLMTSGGGMTVVSVTGIPFGVDNFPYIVSAPGQVAAVAANSQHAVVLVGSGGPIIHWSPLDRVAFTGDTVTFSVGASGNSPLAYQWRFNGTNITAATNSMLILTNVPLAAAGAYACVVTNPIGSSTSQTANLTVLRSILRFNDEATFSLTNGFEWQLEQLSGHGNIIILASTNLVDWTPFLTNPPQLGSLMIADPHATNRPATFYRAVEQ